MRTLRFSAKPVRACATALVLSVACISGGGSESGPPPLSPPAVALGGVGPTGCQIQVQARESWAVGLQRSVDLVQWDEIASGFSEGTPLLFADTEAAWADRFFYRAQLHRPNPAVITNYHGWTNAVLIQNGLVEAFVVPNAGRVMQFRWAGETNGPFWENPTLYGKNGAAGRWDTPGSFGGDKAWPAPQSVWNWPPPLGFDGSIHHAAVSNGVVWMTSPVDSTFKIQVTRRIELAFDEPMMRITTVFERTAATSRTNQAVGVWVVTQLADPVLCYLPVPESSIFTNGFKNLGSGLPKGLVGATNGLLSMPRSRSGAYKIGSDAGTLLWVGTNGCLRIDSPRVPGVPASEYPDSGSSAEIYTNPNPAYVELELLGPLAKLPVGGKMVRTSTYRLYRRAEADPDAEARRILGLAP